mmetsp:Transcript_33112/g.75701  ORF Transcript_33112/g.75701 Transcript_33112/m.75701 type:complete len:297 (+) Transcript_33112:142-1032(+)
MGSLVSLWSFSNSARALSTSALASAKGLPSAFGGGGGGLGGATCLLRRAMLLRRLVARALVLPTLSLMRASCRSSWSSRSFLVSMAFLSRRWALAEVFLLILFWILRARFTSLIWPAWRSSAPLVAALISSRDFLAVLTASSAVSSSCSPASASSLRTSSRLRVWTFSASSAVSVPSCSASLAALLRLLDSACSCSSSCVSVALSSMAVFSSWPASCKASSVAEACEFSVCLRSSRPCSTLLRRRSLLSREPCCSTNLRERSRTLRKPLRVTALSSCSLSFCSTSRSPSRRASRIL